MNEFDIYVTIIKISFFFVVALSEVAMKWGRYYCDALVGFNSPLLLSRFGLS